MYVYLIISLIYIEPLGRVIEQQDIFDCHPPRGGTDNRLTNADFLNVTGGLAASKYENENTSDFDEEDYFDSSVSFKSEEPDDISENSSDKRVDTSYGRARRVSAIYGYNSDTSETITMAEGEEFFVLETDQEGWTKVRRRSKNIYDHRDVGFVPTSFVRTLL